MSVWQYTAASVGSRTMRRGVISAPDAVAARQSLRQAGLRPVTVRAMRSRSGGRLRGFGMFVAGHLRKRRTPTKAECFDALATLVRSGVTPRDALLVLAGSRSRVSAAGVLARTLADDVAQGVPLSEAAAAHPSWFDAAECAVLAAGERSGELEQALRRLADRQSRAHELSAKLAGVLAYPAIVTFAGVGVATFLSVRTLPQLTQVLVDAGVEVPTLTRVVMGLGRGLAHHAVWMFPVFFVLLAATAVLVSSGRVRLPDRAVRCAPAVFRRVRCAESFLALAELTESGLTLVESVRVTAPTASGPLGRALGAAWSQAADRIEQGEPFDAVLDDPAWFTEEHRRLVAAGSRAGELSETLRRLGERDRRSAQRLIDRAATLLEPASIVFLTAFVGLIVLAAILPIVRLQEIVG